MPWTLRQTLLPVQQGLQVPHCHHQWTMRKRPWLWPMSPFWRFRHVISIPKWIKVCHLIKYRISDWCLTLNAANWWPSNKATSKLIEVILSVSKAMDLAINQLGLSDDCIVCLQKLIQTMLSTNFSWVQSRREAGKSTCDGHCSKAKGMDLQPLTWASLTFVARLKIHIAATGAVVGGFF